MNKPSLLWYDYETTGTDPKADRPLQVGLIRTDLAYQPIGEPIELYCRPSNDILPQPDACLITGITPQHAQQHGLIEREYFNRLAQELSRPGTCTIGYNSRRFDDEITRYGLYRNFHDPYAWHWQNGNSRWDLIDLVRSCYALKPDTLHWPQRDDNPELPSFKLDQLCPANGIEQSGAHDALVDVQATIALAQHIQQTQPKLYDYHYQAKDKHIAAQRLSLNKPVLHVSAMIRAEHACISLYLPLAPHPDNKNSTIAWDLRHDPAPWSTLDDEHWQHHAFTPLAQLKAEHGDDTQRLPIKEIHSNQSPALYPVSLLKPELEQRAQLDSRQARQHYDWLQNHPDFAQRLQRLYQQRQLPTPQDPEHQLYSGGFLSPADRQQSQTIAQTPTAKLHQLQPAFQDPRLQQLWLRYKARNRPDALSPEEQQAWEDTRYRRLTETDGGGNITLDAYHTRLDQLEAEPSTQTDPARQQILQQLRDWADSLL